MASTLRDRALLLVLTALVLAPIHLPVLLDPLRFYPDLATAYPLLELARPGLFEGDHFREMVLRFGFPPGYRWALWPLVQIVPLLTALGITSLTLSAAVVQLAYGYHRHLAAAWATSLAALALVVVMDSMHGGYPRAWGLTLTALLLLLMVRQQVTAAALLAGASVLFYPMVFPPAALAVGCWALWRRLRRGRPWTELVVVVALLAAGLGLALWRSSALAALAGAPCTPESCADAPELYTAGNYTYSAFRGRLLLNSVLNLGEHPPAYPWVLGLLLPVATWRALAGWRRPHAAAWLLLAGAGTFALISLGRDLSALPTGYASRAFIFTLPLAAAVGWGSAAAWLSERLRLSWLPIAGLPVLVALATFDPGYVADDHSRLAPVLPAIEELPAGAVLGGHPVTLNPVPLLTGRRVEVIAQAFNPWMQDWWREYKRRANLALDTFYAPTDQAVRQGCAAAGVTHLLVEEERFLPEHATLPGQLDWEPLGSHVRELASHPPFALRERVPPAGICLLDCARLDGPCWRLPPLEPPPPSPIW